MAASAPAALYTLRRAVAEIEGAHGSLQEGRPALAFGIPCIDAALGGGLASGALHEIAPQAGVHLGAATGLVLALAARMAARKQVLWVSPAFAEHEAGPLYGSGLAMFGLSLDRVLLLRVTQAADTLWAMEEGLKCRALACVVGELPDDAPLADLTATRRLTLAVRDGGGFGFLLRHRASPLASAAETRWQVAAGGGRPDRFGGLGRPTWHISLTKNRHGPTGRWPVAWNHHERVFSALSLGVAAPALDRPDRAPLTRTG